MASSLNHVLISGRLTADPEPYRDGKVARFSIACNRSIRDDNDRSWREEVSFFNCAAFNGIATRVLSKLKKGDQLVVTGRLDQSRYEKDGEKRSSVSILVNQIEAEGLFRPAAEPHDAEAYNASIDATLARGAA
jgi:single-strand DNA-binding protein